LSFAIFFGQITNGPGIPSPVFEPGVLVSSAPRPHAASEGILRKGDVILDINGRPLTESASPSAFESQRAINDFISQIRSTPEGESIKLTVLHDGKREEVVSIKPKSQTGTNQGTPSIGVLLTPNYVKSGVLQSKNPVEAAGLAAQYTITLTRETANGILAALGSIFQSKGASSGVQVSGPIGLIRTGADVVSTKDFAAIALFAAALSINLGVVNALPLPALDGGQLVFVIAEALTGRKVDQRIQEGITGVAVLFLLLVSLGAAVGDVSNIVVGR
jgi:RIP metalloprotease RseP